MYAQECWMERSKVAEQVFVFILILPQLGPGARLRRGAGARRVRHAQRPLRVRGHAPHPDTGHVCRR